MAKLETSKHYHEFMTSESPQLRIYDEIQRLYEYVMSLENEVEELRVKCEFK